MYLVFAGSGVASAFAGIALRKKKNAKDAVADGKVAESET